MVSGRTIKEIVGWLLLETAALLAFPLLQLLIIPAALIRLRLLFTAPRRAQEEAEVVKAAKLLGGEADFVTPMQILDAFAKIPLFGWMFLILKRVFGGPLAFDQMRTSIVSGACGGFKFRMEKHGKTTYVRFFVPGLSCEGPKKWVKVEAGHYALAVEPDVDSAARSQLDRVAPGWRFWCQKGYDPDTFKEVAVVAFRSSVMMNGDDTAAVVKTLAAQIKKMRSSAK